MVNQNSIFGGMLTSLGAAKKTNCDALGIPWEPSYMLIGDANDTDPVPSPGQTQLVRQVYRAPLNALYVSPTDDKVLIAELVLPPEVGGWWIRELAIEDKDGVFCAVANVAPSYKPLLAQGSGRNQVVRMHIITNSTTNIQLKIDPSVVLATRSYVDQRILEELSKQDFKHSVLVATSGAITLSGLQTIDSVALTAGNRVLVKNQTQAKDNGLYVAATGAWSRTQDADTSLEVTPGLFVHVEKGEANGDSVWQLVTDGPIVLGTTDLAFEMVAGRTGVNAGSYRSVTVDKYGRVIAGTNPVVAIAEGGTGATTAAAALAALGGAPVAAAIPSVSQLDSTTDFDSLVDAGWQAALYGGAAGERNPNHPDGQLPVSAESGIANYYWGMVAKYASNLIQVAFPYVSSADTALATIKFRLFGGDEKSPWRSLLHLDYFRSAAANATEALRGVLRIGNQGEVNAGALDTVAVTPKKLFNGAVIITGNYAALKLPSWLGGWTLQKGSVTVTAEGSGGASISVTLPIAYTSSYALNATFVYSGGRVDNGNVAQVRDKSLNGFTIDNQWMGSGSSLAGVIDFFAFGK
ncbi:MAG: hypothetical protein DI621_23160 [Pseudomonas protegens]|nr:MAG: hypothetical protein DI621_23160 [Pseudomonas protegens]